MIKWCDSQDLHSQAASQIKAVSSVLDIGCGIRPQQYISPDLLVCVEPFSEYAEILKRNLKDANALILPLDAMQALNALPDRSIDSIFLIDVIEHMSKEIGIQVIKECERVARQQIIIFTPLGFMPQEIHAGDKDGWNLGGGEWQDHKSGWYPEDFPEWDVIACKHLHFFDFQGQKIDPPYGGFYAIKNITRAANLFNDIYSEDVVGSNTSDLSLIKELFPLFSEKVVRRDIEKSILKCGLQSCQRTTELFIEYGKTKNLEEILTLVRAEEQDFFVAESRQHNERIKQFSSQFSEYNEKAANLNERAAELKTIAAKIEHEKFELTLKMNELESKETELILREVELKNKVVEYEAEIARSFPAKVVRRLGKVFK